MLGQHSGCVGTDAEVGRVAQGYDASVPKDEVEGEGEQTGDQHLARERKIGWPQPKAGGEHQPEGDFCHGYAAGGGLMRGSGAHFLLTRPCGRSTNRMTIMA